MTQPAGPTQRVIAVLDFLSTHADRQFSLADLSRELGISKSTLHAISNNLVEAGYMLRSSTDLKLSLGPALIPLGHAAVGERTPYVEAARPAMRDLAHRLGVHCVVSMAVEDRMYVVASEGNPRRVATTFREGQRRQPLIPPFGSVFVAWRDEDEIDAWLDRATHALDPLERAYYQSTLEAFRNVGFAAAARLSASSRIESALSEASFSDDVADDPRRVINELLEEMRAESYLMPDLDPKMRDVDWIAAPMFDDRGKVILSLTLTNFQKPLTADEILTIGRDLKAVADGGSAIVAGSRPS